MSFCKSPVTSDKLPVTSRFTESFQRILTALWDQEPAGVESCARMSTEQCAMCNEQSDCSLLIGDWQPFTALSWEASGKDQAVEDAAGGAIESEGRLMGSDGVGNVDPIGLKPTESEL